MPERRLDVDDVNWHEAQGPFHRKGQVKRDRRIKNPGLRKDAEVNESAQYDTWDAMLMLYNRVYGTRPPPDLVPLSYRNPDYVEPPPDEWRDEWGPEPSDGWMMTWRSNREDDVRDM